MSDPLLFGVGRREEEDISRQVLDVFKVIIFGPAVAILKKNNAQARASKILSNAARTSLLDAIRSGRVQYGDGVFSGKFSSAISNDILALGAEFDSRSNVYKINPARVPAWVTQEAAIYASTMKAMHDSIIKGLDDAQENLDQRLETKMIDATLAIGELAGGWKDAATALEVNPEISQVHMDRLRRKYDENMKLSIKKFSHDEIAELRQVVRGNAMQGYRADRLIAAIEARYDVSKSKATFLARQETSLLVSKFREERFRETVGDDYIWMTSHDGRVRPAENLTPAERKHAGNHRKLDGERFNFRDKAPAWAMSCRKACNPGEDFNCRCVARPILRERVAA